MKKRHHFDVHKNDEQFGNVFIENPGQEIGFVIADKYCEETGIANTVEQVFDFFTGLHASQFCCSADHLLLKLLKGLNRIKSLIISTSRKRVVNVDKMASIDL